MHKHMHYYNYCACAMCIYLDLVFFVIHFSVVRSNFVIFCRHYCCWKTMFKFAFIPPAYLCNWIIVDLLLRFVWFSFCLLSMLFQEVHLNGVRKIDFWTANSSCERFSSHIVRFLTLIYEINSHKRVLCLSWVIISNFMI